MHKAICTKVQGKTNFETKLNNVDQTFWIFTFFMCFWILDIKEMTKVSNKKNLMHKQTFNPKVCAQDKNNQLKTNKQSTHHTRDSRNCTNTDGLTE